MDSLYMATVSDIHLGHRNNPARDIIANLKEAFPDNAQTGDLDIIFLAGDIYDDLLNLPDDEVADIDEWIAYLLRICKKYDIVLRVLEGTPSHDWKQSRRFVINERMVRSGADMQYVQVLSIEYIERFNIHVLYVPDEWDTPEKTLAQVKELMRAKGLDKVDYAIMHGQFEYQLPPVVKAPKHDSAEYMALVKHVTFIGHVHLYSQYGNIIAQGSFDRLTHGEEGPKGHVRARVFANGDKEITFVENTGAKKFVTVSCIGLSLEETLERVYAKAQTLPDGSAVRIEASDTNPIFTNMELLIRSYPLIKWSKLARESQVLEEERYSEDEVTYTPITITRDNLGAMLLERVAAKGATENVLVSSRGILVEVL